MGIKEIEYKCTGWSHLAVYWDHCLLWIEHRTLKNSVNGTVFLDHNFTINLSMTAAFLEVLETVQSSLCK
jgi:hypothetical protein